MIKQTVRIKSLLNIALITGIFASSAMISGCQSQPANKVVMPAIEVSPEGRQKIVNHTVDSVVIPNLDNWQSDAQTLANSSRLFCQNKSADGLLELQQTYKHLSASWNQSIMFDFGPLRDNLFFPKIHFIESMRQRGKDYSNPIHLHFNKRLQDDKVLNTNYFNKLKFTLVGMPAIEVLLFAENNDVLLKSYGNPRKCQLLMGMTNLNADNANYVLQGWRQKSKNSPSYRQLFFTNKLPDGERSLTKIIFALQDYLRYIKQRKLEGKLDAKLSGMSYQNLDFGLEAIHDTLSARETGYGLYDYLQKAGKSTVVVEFESHLKGARTALQKQDLTDLKEHYSAMIKMLEQQIPNALGVNLGMNFVDGD